MTLWVRNLTKDTDFELVLPMDVSKLKEKLDSKSEYMIIDNDNVLDPYEFSSILELNEFLQECDENEITEETLKILSSVLIFEEVLSVVRNDQFVIVNFDDETASWNCGRGGDFNSDFDKGLLLHELEMYRFDWEKDFTIKEEMIDDICWDNLWVNANCSGWSEVKCEDKNYLVFAK